MRPLALLRAAAIALLALAAPAAAQVVPALPDTAVADSASAPLLGVPTLELEPRGHGMARLLAGVSLFYVQPRGDFASHVKRGIGYSVTGSFAADTAGIVALRAEWQDVVYGHETRDDTSVSNVIRSLDVGPQLMLPSGGVRPYVSASVGVAYTGTHGSRPCRRNCEYDEWGDAEPEGFSLLPRMTWSVARAAGVLFRVAKATAARPALWLDLRLSHRSNGETRYGVNGADRSVKGETSYRVVHVGMTTGMR